MNTTTVMNDNLDSRSLFLNRAYLQLLISKVISRIGDSIDMIAYSWMVYQMTGSELLLGSIFMVNGLPGIILSPFAGVLVDHFSKKWIAVFCDLGRGIIVLLTALFFYFHMLEVWHLFLFTILNSSLETFENPAKSSIFTLVLNQKDFLKGSSILQSASSIAEIIGAAMAGFIIVTFGISGAILIDSITFFISSILMLTLLFKDLIDHNKLNFQSYFMNLRGGFHYIISKRIILISMLLVSVINFFIAPISVLMPVYVKNVLHTDAGGLSYLSVGLALGSIVCGLFISTISKKIKSGILVILGTVGMGIFTSILSLPAFNFFQYVNPLYFVTLVFFLIGFSIVLITAPLKTYIYKHTPKEMIGRVFSLLGAVSLSILPLGGFVSGVVAELLPVSMIFLITGILLVFIAIVPLLNKEFRNE